MSDIVKQEKSTHEDETFQCIICETKLKNKKNLRIHMQSIHEGKIFQCKLCEYKAKRINSLKRHIQSIHEGKAFQLSMQSL